MKYLETEEEKNHLQSHQLFFVILFVLFFYLD
jgi:hypothetical protein